MARAGVDDVFVVMRCVGLRIELRNFLNGGRQGCLHCQEVLDLLMIALNVICGSHTQIHNITVQTTRPHLSIIPPLFEVFTRGTADNGTNFLLQLLILLRGVSSNFAA